MKPGAVLFDLDGTLLDTLEDLAQCMNTVLRGRGYPEHGVEAFRYFVGAGLENLVRRALPEGLGTDPLVVSECLQAMRKEYGARWHEKTRPYDGIPQLLDTLTGRALKMTILSNKPDDFTNAMARWYFSAWTFEIVWGERPGIARKPDPTSALEIAEQLRIPPEKFLYLGDTGTDMQTAAAAGMTPVGVLWGFRTARELLENGARILIEEPAELISYL